MKKNIQIRNKKYVPIVGAIFIALALGMVVASVFYSQKLSQTTELKGLSGYIDLSIDTPLPSIVFKGDSIECGIMIERINPAFEDIWEMVVVFNSSAGDLLSSQITLDKLLTEGDHSTVIISSPAIMTQNGTSVYSSLFTMSDWSTFVVQSDIAFLDLSFVLSNGISDGTISVDVFVIDALV